MYYFIHIQVHSCMNLSSFRYRDNKVIIRVNDQINKPHQ